MKHDPSPDALFNSPGQDISFPARTDVFRGSFASGFMATLWHLTIYWSCTADIFLQWPRANTSATRDKPVLIAVGQLRFRRRKGLVDKWKIA